MFSADSTSAINCLAFLGIWTVSNLQGSRSLSGAGAQRSCSKVRCLRRHWVGPGGSRPVSVGAYRIGYRRASRSGTPLEHPRARPVRCLSGLEVRLAPAVAQPRGRIYRGRANPTMFSRVLARRELRLAGDFAPVDAHRLRHWTRDRRGVHLEQFITRVDELSENGWLYGTVN